MQYKACTKERVSRLGWMCPYLVGGCEFERSSDTWKLPTMAPAALRGEIEMVFKKKKKISSSSCRPTGQEGRAGIMERDREGRWRLCWGCNRGRSSKDAIRLPAGIPHCPFHPTHSPPKHSSSDTILHIWLQSK